VQRDGGWFIKFGHDTNVAQASQQVLLNETNFDLLQVYPQLTMAYTPLQLMDPNQPWLQLPFTDSFLRPHNGLVSPSWESILVQPNSSFVITPTHPNYKLLYDTVVSPLDSIRQPAQTDEALRQLIDKALNAAGGENALRRLTAFTLEVKETDAEGRISAITHFVQLPDHYRVEISRQGENAKEIHILGSDGMRHWRKRADGTVEPLNLFGLEPTREYWLDFVRFFGPRAVLRLKEPTYQLKRLDEIDIHFRPAIGIQLTASSSATPGKSFVSPERKLYLDKETGLLVKELQDHLELLYGAHRSLNGITSAQKWSERRGKEQEPVINSIEAFKILDKLDPALFQKP
jgi:hypothetical protein